MKNALAFALALTFASTAAQAVQLVSDDTIKTQKDLTATHTLKNGIKVITRKIEASDIVSVNIAFHTGLKDLKPGKKALNEWLWAVLPMGSKNYPKAKLFETMEKYAFEIGCGGGIELSTCSLNAVNDYWAEGLGVLADVIKNPAFTDEDIKLTKDRMTANLKNVQADPGQYINEIVNTIFYETGHPYRLNHDEALAELEKLGKQDLIDQHKAVVNTGMTIVVVGSMAPEKVIADLEAAFADASTTKSADGVVAVPPAFDASKAYNFSDRDLPTAYIRIKLNAPAVGNADAVGAKVLYEILGEELQQEVRTKRSLSYAVGAFLIQYSMGVGVISASTSKPQETITAINDVITALKNRTYTPEELAEFKNAFGTSYFLTLETHASLASALQSANHFYGSTDELYDMPRKLDKVSAEDIKRLAGDLIKDLRVGVIFGRSAFKDEWARELITKTSGSSPKGH